MSARRPHVVFVGGGYVTIYAVAALRRAVRRGEIDCTVIDKNNYHTFHGLIAEMITGKIQPGQIISPARKLFQPAAFHNALVEKIDTERREIVTSRALDGREYVVNYDLLVVAPGCVDNLSRYPGISEHALKLKNYWDCFRLRSHILRMLEMAEYETDAEERRRLLTFVVAGANYAGIEVASDLIDYMRLLTRRQYPRIRPEEIRVVVVHSGKRILPELGSRFPRLIDYADAYLAGQGLEFMMETRLASATPAEVILTGGQSIRTRTLISCTGTAPSPLLEQVGGERDDRGRAVTEPTCEMKGRDGMWAGGDCAAVPHPKGGHCPPLAIYAMKAGTQIGRNIVRHVRGQAQRPLRFTGLGDACAFGGRRAVAHLKGVPLKGYLAWLLWRVFMLIYLPATERRARILADWLLTPLVGRDIVSLETDEQLGLSTARYEAGQVIIQEGDTGHDMFVIQKGEVTVERGGEELGTLAAGSHFGEKGVFNQIRRTATVRARTQVNVLVIKRDQARMLRSSLDQFESIGETPTLRHDS